MNIPYMETKIRWADPAEITYVDMSRDIVTKVNNFTNEYASTTAAYLDTVAKRYIKIGTATNTCRWNYSDDEDSTISGYTNCVNTTSTATRVWKVRNGWYIDSGNSQTITVDAPVIPLSERLREIIRSRMAPAVIIPTRKPLMTPEDLREARARETLRRVIGEEKFARFLRTGFISVRAKSGRFYQLFPGHGITRVFENGELVERLCVYLQGNFPPTDDLIMRYLLVLNDEEGFRAKANKHSIAPSSLMTMDGVDRRPLPEIMSFLKLAA